MAAKPTKTARALWEREYQKYAELNLNLAVAEAPPQQLEKIGNAIAKQIDILLELPAGSIAQVIAKLQIIWEADLEKPDRDGAEKLQIIDDLHDLADEARELIGERE
jgi:muramidase (phage lysozyme)